MRSDMSINRAAWGVPLILQWTQQFVAQRNTRLWITKPILALGIGVLLTSCASVSEPVEVVSGGEVASAPEVDPGSEPMNAEPCEGQSADYGCYAVPQTVPVDGGLVMDSSGPSVASYPRGMELADTAQITLKAGDSVSVLRQSGLREFKGPGTFRIGDRSASRRSAFAALTRARSNRRARTGAVRSASSIPERGPQMLVIRGDDAALSWYGKGRRLPLRARICLPDNAQYITFQRTDGGTITYGGGGCNKRADDPTTAADESLGVGSGP